MSSRNFSPALWLVFVVLGFAASAAPAQNKHSAETKYPAYTGLVMAGYQGWFRAPDKGLMYPDETHIHIDAWPDMTEYEKSHPTGLKFADGSTARFCNSADKSTVDLHFRWMKQYGVDGVFMQRFWRTTDPKARNGPEVQVLRNALAAASDEGRAIAVFVMAVMSHWSPNDYQ